MPSKKPQINIRLQPEDYEVIKRVCEITGKPQTELVQLLMSQAISKYKAELAKYDEQKVALGGH